MITLRKSEDRGHVQIDWLKSHHSFSFGEYYDPKHMGFGDLRVINEDWVAPSGGFPTHPHRDMEIVTIVLEGELQHRDSLGTGSVIRPGEVQKMSAGSGIRHSEFNASDKNPVHLLQIWVMPDTNGIAPSYEQKTFDPKQRVGKWQLVAAKGGEGDVISMHQDVKMYLGKIDGTPLSFDIAPERIVWAQIVEGSAQCGDHKVKAGDALAFRQESQASFTGDATVLLFDLAP